MRKYCVRVAIEMCWLWEKSLEYKKAELGYPNDSRSLLIVWGMLLKPAHWKASTVVFLIHPTLSSTLITSYNLLPAWDRTDCGQYLGFPVKAEIKGGIKWL